LCHIFPPVLLLLFACGAVTGVCAADPATAGAEASELCIYRIRAADARAVFDLIGSIVDDDRMVLNPMTRELAVFASPSVHELVADRIATHEDVVPLVEVIDLKHADPRQVLIAIKTAFGTGAARDEEANAPSDDPPTVEMDARTRRLFVRAKKPQIEIINEIIERLEKSDAVQDLQGNESNVHTAAESPKSKAPVVGTDERPLPPPANQPGSDSDQRKEPGNQPGRRTRPLLAPIGPVRIVHIEGTNLLLIRGRGGGDGQEARLPAPTGPVRIEHIPGTDLLLIRGRGCHTEPERRGKAANESTGQTQPTHPAQPGGARTVRQ